MRSKYFINLKTKKGAASFYIIIFVTLVLGVIVLGFTRVMLQEATNTTDSDLSQSAYDAALAGVEDAKSALIKCGREGNGSCDRSLFGEGMSDRCNMIAPVLYGGRSDQEVQLTERSGNQSVESQAYTCVKVDDRVEDYRVTLTSKMQIKVIPLNVNGGFSHAKNIIVSWYSNNNKTDKDESSTQYLRDYDPTGKYYFTASGAETNAPTAKSDEIPPIISAELVQADQQFNWEEFFANSGDYGAAGTNRSLSILYPTKAAENRKRETKIGTSQMLKNGTDQENHAPIPIECGDVENPEFACTANLEIPPAMKGGEKEGKNSEVAYLIVSIPYGRADVDMQVSVTSDEGSMDFKGVQYKVDSTGRANNIYRRVSSRIEIGNINFPFPEYSAQVGLPTSTGKNDLTKNFWITHDCQRTINEKRNADGTWPSIGPSKGYGSYEPDGVCANSGNL